MKLYYVIEDDIKNLSGNSKTIIPLGDGVMMNPLVNLVDNILVDFWSLEYMNPTMDADDFAVCNSRIGRIRGDIRMCVDALIKVVVDHFNSLMGEEKTKFYHAVYEKVYIRPLFLLAISVHES